MGLDWKISFKTEAGEYVDANKWDGNAGSRYYGPYSWYMNQEDWYNIGNWPRIRRVIEDLREEYKSPLYYWSDHHDEPYLVTDDLLNRITEHYNKENKK